MKILVVGDGKVGHIIAENLAGEGHDVVIVDNDEQALQRSEATLDVLCVRGNGANAQTLIDAGALRGRGDGQLDVSEDMLRTLIIVQRMLEQASE